MTLLQQLAVMVAYYEGRIHGLESARDMPQARMCWLMSHGIPIDQIAAALEKDIVAIRARLALMECDAAMLALHGAFRGAGLPSDSPYGSPSAVAREVSRIAGHDPGPVPVPPITWIGKAGKDVS